VVGDRSAANSVDTKRRWAVVGIHVRLLLVVVVMQTLVVSDPSSVHRRKRGAVQSAEDIIVELCPRHLARGRAPFLGAVVLIQVQQNIAHVLYRCRVLLILADERSEELSVGSREIAGGSRRAAGGRGGRRAVAVACAVVAIVLAVPPRCIFIVAIRIAFGETTVWVVIPLHRRSVEGGLVDAGGDAPRVLLEQPHRVLVELPALPPHDQVKDAAVELLVRRPRPPAAQNVVNRRRDELARGLKILVCCCCCSCATTVSSYSYSSSSVVALATFCPLVGVEKWR